MKNLQMLGLGLTSLLFISTANAGIINTWDVSSTSKVNCSSGGTGYEHGLWTNTLQTGGSCSQYFNFDAGTTLIQYDNNTAVLSGSATNGSNVTADINITFGGFQDTYSSVKTGGGNDTSDWDFYTTIESGSTIVINNTTYYVDIHDAPGDDFVMQIGTGANDKTSAFGASSWLDIYEDEARTKVLYEGGQHWDLNMDLTARVPEPQVLFIFTMGLIGLGLSRRYTRK